MTIENGYIRYIHASGGGIDSTTGHAIPVSEERGPKIPCQFYARKANALARNNGEAVTEAGWYILTEENSVPRSERLVLLDRSGREIGAFSVISSEPLEAVCMDRITV